ncbi:aspartate carbamoyltransferase [Clostridium sp. B9]|uniref:aspartate carbamoyltransferase n=1 Tax=Clostridium sp. B9 TaxID=3423224 RepID=UPI003D2E9F71
MKNKEIERKCKNPKCITQVEKYVPQSFTVFDKKNNICHCDYCHGENQFPKL